MNALILYLLRYWNGRLKLLHAFLHVYLPLTVVWIIFKALVADVANTRQSSGEIVVWVTIAVGLTLSIYKCIGLWRCANNADKTFYRYLARVIAISPLIIAISGILIIFVADILT
ncbi:MAG TPA: hypothetical protein DCE52_03290 [Rhodobacteraceae bacterium]|nr:hypothetical protein [Paracoccaceae bacterium]